MDNRLKQIADFYGIEVQAVKLAEECAEYSAAAIKVNYHVARLEYGSYTAFNSDHIYEELFEAREKGTKELADVLLVARQMEYLIDQRPELRTRIDKLMEAKVERQLKRIEEEKRK